MRTKLRKIEKTEKNGVREKETIKIKIETKQKLLSSIFSVLKLPFSFLFILWKKIK